MAGSSVKVIADNRIPEWGVGLERAIVDALTETMPLLVAEAQQRETVGHGTIRGSVHGLGVEPSGRGFATGVGASDWRSVWFEKGTAAHSTKSGTRGQHSLTKTGRKRRKAGGLTSGVKGVHYLRDTVYALKPEFLSRLAEHMNRVRTGL